MKPKFQAIRQGESTDPSACNWRPWPLRLPFLIFFGCLCVLPIVAIEFIVRGCSKGCYVFGKSTAETPSQWTNFAYNQFPTVVSLALSLVWALPHHNILRLEPYFRMSAKGGATASDSIFLKYPYTFPLFVPYYAAKNRSVNLSVMDEYVLTVKQTLRRPTVVRHRSVDEFHDHPTDIRHVQSR